MALSAAAQGNVAGSHHCDGGCYAGDDRSNVGGSGGDNAKCSTMKKQL